MSAWAVTRYEHPTLEGSASCEGCEALVPQAITTARVTGSTGATQRAEGPGGVVRHSATVMRLRAAYNDSGERLS